MSVGTAVVAVIFLPPVFGAISIFAGYKVYTQYDEALGKQLMALGVGATVAGVALGAYIVTQMG